MPAAVAIWRPLAEDGDADAAFNLGQAYRLGRGVPIDLAAAQTWFERAARKGHVDAQTTLGLLLFQNGNRVGGLRWLKSAAEARRAARAADLRHRACSTATASPATRCSAYAYVSRAAAQGLAPAKDDARRHGPDPAARPAQARASRWRRWQGQSRAGPAANGQAAPPSAASRSRRRQSRRSRSRSRSPPASRPSPASGAWRIQLGAFSSAAAEVVPKRCSGKLSGKLAGRQAFYVPAGAVTRLQAGPFESRAAATAACAHALSKASPASRSRPNSSAVDPLPPAECPAPTARHRARDGRAGVGDCGERRLGAVGDAQPGFLDHQPVVGAVADRQHVCQRPGRARSRASISASRLAGASTIGSPIVAAELAVRRCPDDWRANAIEPDVARRSARRRTGSRPRPAGSSRPSRASSGPGSPRPGSAGPARPGSARSIARRSPASSATRSRKRAGEIELALHRPLGDRGDLGFEPGIIGELVDAFLADDGRIHVGDEQPLRRAARRLDDDVDASGARRAPSARPRRSPSRTQVGGVALVDPAAERRARIELAQQAERALDQPVIEPSGCYQRRNAMSTPQVLLSPSSPVRPRAASRRWRWRWPKRTGGVIVNADSAQVYRDLPILSAAPTAEDRSRAEHRLYGVLRRRRCPARRPTGRRWPKREIDEVHARGRLPILVGGTGLYLRTLLDGIAPVPPIDPDVRREVRAATVDGQSRRELDARPGGGGAAQPGDTTRIARALEVVLSTGRTLARMAAAARGRDRRRRRAAAADPAAAARLALRALRRAVRGHGRARARSRKCEALLAARARPQPAGDARDRRARDRAPTCAARSTSKQAIAAGQQATRRYAKRQYTWFAHQPPAGLAAVPRAARGAASSARWHCFGAKA